MAFTAHNVARLLHDVNRNCYYFSKYQKHELFIMDLCKYNIKFTSKLSTMHNVIEITHAK